MEEKKNVNQTRELKEEDLDNVAGGMMPIDYATWAANGNETSIKKCWWCNKEYQYAPKDQWGNTDDPWSHFCCAEHRRLYEIENSLIEIERK